MGRLSVDWAHLAQDRFQWRALVNTAMNHLVPRKGGEFFDHVSEYQLLKRGSAPGTNSVFMPVFVGPKIPTPLSASVPLWLSL
jgi:hypothetical protein